MCVCVCLSLHANHLSASHEWESGLSQVFIDYYNRGIVVLEEAASILVPPTSSIHWISRSPLLNDDHAFGWPGRLGA